MLAGSYDVSMRTQRLEPRLTSDECQLDNAARVQAQAALTDQPHIALSKDEASRFLEALDKPDAQMVLRLRSLRERA
jgi:uncharacterized protein (DUF1778 family)